MKNNKYFRGVRFKYIYPTYDSFLEKTGIVDFPKELYTKILSLHGNDFMSQNSEEDINGMVLYYFTNDLPQYILISAQIEKGLEELQKESSENRTGAFNPKNVVLSDFNENNNNFLTAFYHSKSNINRNMLDTIVGLQKDYKSAQEQYMNSISPCFAMSNDIQSNYWDGEYYE